MPSRTKENTSNHQGKRRGAPRGNRNALRHGFYSSALEEAEQLELEAAQDIEGLDAEIALLRFKLKNLLVKAPDNLPLQLEAARTLARLVQVKYGLPTGKKAQLSTAMADVIKNLGIPLGILAGTKLGGL